MLTLAAEDLRVLRSWMSTTLGLKGEDYRPSFLSRRVSSRLKATGCDDVASYLDLLQRSPLEARILSEKLLVPTTEFFRNPEVFEALAPHLAQRCRGRRRLHLVSAPCSTGEEAVSFAVMMEELRLPGTVWALDRSRRALGALKAGSFPARAVDKVDTKLQRRYFRRVGETASVAQRVLDRIIPVCCDLGDGLPIRVAQVVAVRNLFIYLTEEAQARILDGVGRALEPGGLLVLGRAETLPPSRAASWVPLDRAARIYAWHGGPR